MPLSPVSFGAVQYSRLVSTSEQQANDQFTSSRAQSTFKLPILCTGRSPYTFKIALGKSKASHKQSCRICYIICIMYYTIPWCTKVKMVRTSQALALILKKDC
jgi:hypothetical protein